MVLSVVGIFGQIVELTEYRRFLPKCQSASTITARDRSVLAIDKEDEPIFTLDEPELGLFAPTINYRIEQPSEGNNNNAINNKSCHDHPQRNVTWEWNRYSSDHKHSNSTRKKVLIGMYAGFDQYARLLQHTAHVNKAYAKKRGYDFVVLQGTALAHPEHCVESGRKATLNKIRLLFHAIDNQYDQLLLLDADALIVNLDTKLTELIPRDKMVAAHQVNRTAQAWNINAGVMLWNVHHPLTRGTAVEWFQNARQGVLHDDKFLGDQVYLQRALRGSDARMAAVLRLTMEFSYGHGTFVKHFIREREHKNWKDPDILAHREERIRAAAEQACAKYAGVCDTIEEVVYPTT